MQVQMKDFRFIVSVFGEKHIGMLLTNLYSISENANGCKVAVFWQGISDKIKNEFRQAFSGVEFYDTNFDLSSGQAKRISSKTLFWNLAAKKFKDQNLCFVDVDTLVIKDIRQFFEPGFDVAFTYKDEACPLNTGVLLCKGKLFPIFFKNWLTRTLEIINDPALLSRSVSAKFPFGGADQMSFYQIINYTRTIDKYEINLEDKKIIFHGIACGLLNETRSTNITEDTHIIHYKGGWQPILLQGKGFTINRPKNKSWEMYVLYLKTHKAALEHFNKSLNTNHGLGSFGIQIPIYLNRNDFTENSLLYGVFYIFSALDKLFSNGLLLSKYIIDRVKLDLAKKQ